VVETGADWFAGRLDDTNRLPKGLHDLGSYYKWPLFLWSAGRFDLAERVFQVLVTDFMNADGDFRTDDEKSSDPIYGMIADSYTNTWPIAAARALKRPEVGRAGLDCLRQRRVKGAWDLPERSAILNCDVTGEMGYHLTQYALELAGGGESS